MDERDDGERGIDSEGWPPRVEWDGVGVRLGETGWGGWTGWDSDACLSRDVMVDWLIASFDAVSSAAGRAAVEMVNVDAVDRRNQPPCDAAADGAVIARDSGGGPSAGSIGGGGGVAGVRTMELMLLTEPSVALRDEDGDGSERNDSPDEPRACCDREDEEAERVGGGGGTASCVAGGGGGTGGGGGGSAATTGG